MISECEDLQRRLAAESDFLFDKGTQVDLKTVQNDGTDRIKLTERILNKLFKSFI